MTTLREREAVAWAGEFSQFIAALQGFIAVEVRRLPRLTIVVVARERDFARFRPLRDDGKAMEVAGFFARRDAWAVAGVAGAQMSDDVRATVFHEGTHWFLSGFELPNPVWLEEGLAEVFSTFTTDGKTVAWGRAIETHVDMLRLTGRMPLERLLFLGHDHLHGDGAVAALRTDLAYAQSWAFVHYLIFGRRDVPKGALMDYVARLRQAVHPDEAFRQAFGGSYAEVDRKLGEYLQSGRYYVARQPVVARPALSAEPAGGLEVEDALARLRMAGRRHDEARAGVERALAVAPDDPRLLSLRGEIAQEREDNEAALAAYREAVAKGAREFKPYFEIAAADHAAAMGQESTGGSLSAEAARAIANTYERAINLNPRYRPAYQGLAGVVHRLPPDNAEDRRFLEYGVRLFPDDGMIRLGLAILYRRSGEDQGARALLGSVLANAAQQPPPVVGRARLLESEWEQSDLQARIDRLVKEKKFAEAIAAVDAGIAESNLLTRPRLISLRGSLLTTQLQDELRAAFEERRWADARARCEAVIESDAVFSMKSVARHYLGQLDKRGLGRKKQE